MHKTKIKAFDRVMAVCSSPGLEAPGIESGELYEEGERYVVASVYGDEEYDKFHFMNAENGLLLLKPTPSGKSRHTWVPRADFKKV